ncbi:MAG: 16S rRNA (cytidine(1402)-2'-O)-methyltransferase [Bacillota bacterium]|nr:16S rRNA (cytidine(1402)-2'-O)-methyltransferase [Bacillota bacterium]
MSTLYLVATPVGNLGDLSPRALETLKNADLILAEDTRVTRKLLNAFEISTPLESCHQHNERQKAGQIIERMSKENLNVALVSDAGTPAVSDPGAIVVALANAAGIPVISVPGPSAVILALSKSGFPQTEFTFYGFLPRKKRELIEKLESMKGKAKLAVLYESPHRVLSLLEAINEVFPDSRVSVSRELTKLHEQTLTGQVKDILNRFSSDEGLLRGEFALVLEVPETENDQAETAPDLSLEARIMDLMAKGHSFRDAKAALITNGHKKNAVYAAGLNLKKLAENLLDKDGAQE